MMEMDKYQRAMRGMQKQATKRAMPRHRRKHAEFILHCKVCYSCRAHLDAKLQHNEVEAKERAKAHMPDPAEVVAGLFRSLGCKV